MFFKHTGTIHLRVIHTRREMPSFVNDFNFYSSSNAHVYQIPLILFAVHKYTWSTKELEHIKTIKLRQVNHKMNFQSIKDINGIHLVDKNKRERLRSVRIHAMHIRAWVIHKAPASFIEKPNRILGILFMSVMTSGCESEALCMN